MYFFKPTKLKSKIIKSDYEYSILRMTIQMSIENISKIFIEKCGVIVLFSKIYFFLNIYLTSVLLLNTFQFQTKKIKKFKYSIMNLKKSKQPFYKYDFKNF